MPNNDYLSSGASIPARTSIDTSDTSNIREKREWEDAKLFGARTAITVGETEEDTNILDFLRDMGRSAVDNTKSFLQGNVNNGKLLTRSSAGIFGMPYQFPEIVDTLADNSDYGRKYLEKIVTDMPVLFLSPGEPVFMADYDKRDVQAMVDDMLDNERDVSITDIGLRNDGRYYSFESKFTDCCRYVDIAVRALASFKGIGNVSIPVPSGGNMKMHSFSLRKLMNKDFARYFGAQTSIPFYLESETQISESFSNDTSESFISSTANAISDKAREAQFLMGSHGFSDSPLYKGLKNAAANSISAMNDVIDMLPVGKTILSTITQELVTVASGGKLVFPEIWSGSSYSRSYSINMKFRSPDPDPLSILLNVELPIIILISMTAGRQFGRSANAYGSPYIVRGTYKSIFACDLGIISDLSISRGGENGWNGLGQATTADVSVTLKDLYSNMFISKTAAGLMANTAQLDWLSVLAGLDMNMPTQSRRAGLYARLAIEDLKSVPGNLWGRFGEGLNRFVNKTLNVTIGDDIRYSN